MKLFAFDENTWLYPDTLPEIQKMPSLYLARGGHTAVQILTDVNADKAAMEAELPQGITAEWYQLLPTYVEENSGKNVLTTLNYEEVKDFVTRQAPFTVFDITKPIENPESTELQPGRTAFFIRLYAAQDMVPVEGKAKLVFTVNGEHAELVLPITVTAARVPALKDSNFGIVNWMSPQDICQQHHVEEDSKAFWDQVDAYMDNQLELRTNHLKLPAGVPVRNSDGKVIDFDFSLCEKMGKRALEKGYAYIYGDFVARFQQWDHAGQYILWDKEIEASSREGYRQMKLYFTKLWSIVVKNGWQDQWMQCLVDEPQFYNSESYRNLSAICRKCMPGVTIHDPVETTDVEGAMDIWCVKQAVYDKYKDSFKNLQELGESLWVYTCGFPAGKWMNRSTDLPLLAGRLPFWMCAKEHFDGFLHWGYNAYNNNDPVRHNCFTSETRMLPPGDGFIVYPSELGPINSVRSQGQLFGAEDCELLKQLPEEKMQALCAKLCKDFEHYESDPSVFAQVRRELLEAF